MEVWNEMLSYKYAKINVPNRLFVLYFILSFWNITYQSNVYILYSVLFIPFLLISKMDKYLHLHLIFFMSIFCIQLVYHGSNDAFRIYKTVAVLLPVFLFGQIEKKDIKFDLLDFFIYTNVAIVYIDFFLFFITGATITSIGNSNFMPRIGALTEDSNFYSYMILVYSFFKLVKTHRLPYICLFSILLSGSFAAILVSILLLLLYHKINKFETIKQTKRFRNAITGFTITVFLAYFLLIYFSDDIITYFKSLKLIGLLEVKIISMSHRFLVQNESMMLFIERYNLFWGAGAGETVNLNSLGLNLHNSYCQLLLESGLLCFLLVLSVIAFMGKTIHNLKIYVLFCAVFLLGCIMEVLYFPLLSFVYYYNRTQIGK